MQCEEFIVYLYFYRKNGHRKIFMTFILKKKFKCKMLIILPIHLSKIRFNDYLMNDKF